MADREVLFAVHLQKTMLLKMRISTNLHVIRVNLEDAGVVVLSDKTGDPNRRPIDHDTTVSNPRKRQQNVGPGKKQDLSEIRISNSRAYES